MNQLMLTAPQKLSDIYKKSFYVFRHVFARVFLLSLLAIIVSVILIALLPIKIDPKVLNEFHYYIATSNKQAFLQALYNSNFISLFLLTYLIIQIIYSYLIIAIISLIKQVCNKEPLKISLALKNALYKFFPMLILNIALFIIYLAGLALFYLPGIFAIILLFAAPIALIVDNKDIISAIKTSAKLVWGKWWLTFGFLVLFGLTYAAVSLIAHLMSVLIVELLSMLNGIVSTKILFILTTACDIGVWIVFLAAATWFLCAKVMTYYYLKNRGAVK